MHIIQNWKIVCRMGQKLLWTKEKILKILYSSFVIFFWVHTPPNINNTLNVLISEEEKCPQVVYENICREMHVGWDIFAWTKNLSIHVHSKSQSIIKQKINLLGGYHTWAYIASHNPQTKNESFGWLSHLSIHVTVSKSQSSNKNRSLLNTVAIHTVDWQRQQDDVESFKQAMFLHE